MESLAFVAAAASIGPVLTVIGMCGVVIGAILYVPVLVLSIPSEHATQLEAYRQHIRHRLNVSQSSSRLNIFKRNIVSLKKSSGSTSSGFSSIIDRDPKEDFISSLLSTSTSSTLASMVEFVPSIESSIDHSLFTSTEPAIVANQSNYQNNYWRSLLPRSQILPSDSFKQRKHSNLINYCDVSVLNDDLVAALQRGEGPFKVYM